MRPIALKPKPIIVEEKIIGISDSISYLTELIIQLSKYVTKRGLSKNGVNAFLLFFLTGGLLLTNTQMPTTLMDRLKLYFVPLLFLLYFFVDLAKNNDKINTFFRRLGQRTEFKYQNIMDGNTYYEDLEYDLSELNFNYKQITNILKKLIESEQFTPNLQQNLLLNNAIYRIDTLPLIRDSLIKPISINTTVVEDELVQGEGIINDTLPIDINWTPSAVCIFLSNMRKNLSKEYLDKLIEKYGKYPSVLIAIGYFNQYKKGEDTFFKIGNEFKYTKKWTKISKFLFLVIFVILIIFILFLTFSSLNEKQNYFLYFFVTSFLFVIFLLVSDHVKENELSWSLKSHLKNYDVINDDFVVNQIISDLNESF